MRHRRGTPGLTPYRLRTIEAGYPRRRRPARHAANRTAPRTRGPVPRSIPGRIARNTPRLTSGRIPHRVIGSQVALGVAGAITLALLVIGGYQAATGAAVVLGMF